VAIVLPRRGVATARAYAWLDQHRDAKRLTPTKRVHTISPLRADRMREAPGMARAENDLEEVVRRHYPEIDAARQVLVEQGLGSVRMTGSGSAVFGILPRGRDPLGWVTRLGRSPFDVVMARFTRFGSLWCRSGRAARMRPDAHLPPAKCPRGTGAGLAGP
jgi:GHMP kinase-like protein